ncbi:hypothetical protein [Amycolatopsis sp. cmx-8-4]|uniref:hypothetical protein n=1 Tax=Amycolatopsis sp. cmx-8-4 TaxID=2790947 RepID=UPI00397BAA04
MGVPEYGYSIVHRRASRRPRVLAGERKRWLLLALVTFAVVPADDDGSAWAMVATLAVVILLVVAGRAVRRAAAKVDAALVDELDPQ